MAKITKVHFGSWKSYVSTRWLSG